MDELDAAHQCISSLDHRTATSRSTDIAPQPTPSLAEVGEKKNHFFFRLRFALAGGCGARNGQLATRFMLTSIYLVGARGTDAVERRNQVARAKPKKKNDFFFAKTIFFT